MRFLSPADFSRKSGKFFHCFRLFRQSRWAVEIEDFLGEQAEHSRFEHVNILQNKKDENNLAENLQCEDFH